MMPRCVQWLRGDDKTVGVCLWCEGVPAARRVATQYEDHGYTVAEGVCRSCVARFKADSLLNSPFLLMGT